MPEASWPAGLTEAAFLAEYEGYVLRKPQVVADTALRALAFCPPRERPALVALLAEQLVEASLRLAAVVDALDDRRLPVAERLRGPLPGADAWTALAQLAATAEPEGLLRRLALDESALESAVLLRGLPAPEWLPDLIAVRAAADALFLPVTGDAIAATGANAEGERLSVRLAAGENATVAIADLIADLCSVARGFLAAYLRARQPPEPPA